MKLFATLRRAWSSEPGRVMREAVVGLIRGTIWVSSAIALVVGWIVILALALSKQGATHWFALLLLH